MTVLTIGRKLVPLAQVALVELFDPSANPAFRPEKEYKSRLVLLSRDIVLTEQTVDEFATEHIPRVREGGIHIISGGPMQPDAEQQTKEVPLADDVLRGAEAIAEDFCFAVRRQISVAAIVATCTTWRSLRGCRCSVWVRCFAHASRSCWTSSPHRKTASSRPISKRITPPQAASLSSLSAPRMTIFGASSGNSRCKAFSSSHGARSHTTHSSALVSSTGMAFG